MPAEFRPKAGLLAFCACLPGLLVASTAAAPPTISAVAPQAVVPGQTVEMVLSGEHLGEATECWTSFEGQATLVPGNSSSGSLAFRLQTSADAAPGIYGLRVVTKQGVSNLKLIAVDDLASVQQSRPNQSAAQAQLVSLPIAIDGHVDDLQRDYYRFRVNAGQRLSFEVLARRLGSPLDPIIRLLDSRGRELAYSDDALGLGADALLSYTFADAGDYVLELRDIRYQGSGKHAYRLRIGDFPAITTAYPLGIQKGVSANIAFGSALASDVESVPLHIGADSHLAWQYAGARTIGGKSRAFAAVSVGVLPELCEVEPNDAPGSAMHVALGDCLNGRIDRPGDVDHFSFAATAGQHFVFSGVTRTQGSPCDLFLRLLKSDGAEVAAADDGDGSEGHIDFTFPADGDYTLAIEDLHRRGGPEFVYRIAVEPFREKFSLASATDTINVAAGGLALVTVTATRGKFTGPIQLSLVDAPPGITATSAVIPPGMSTVPLTISCDANIAPGKMQFVQIAGTSQQGDESYSTIASVVEAQKAEFNGLPNPPPALANLVAVGVGPAPAFVLKAEPAEVVLGQNLSATVKITATRAAGFDQEITLADAPGAAGLPTGVKAAFKPIAKGNNQVEVTLTANGSAANGPSRVAFVGTGKQGEVSSTQPTPAILLSLRPPFTLKPDFGSGSIAAGQSLKVKVSVQRNPAFAGPITLTFTNLPAGVTAAPATIAAGEKEAEAILTAAADAKAGKFGDVVVRGEGAAGKSKVTASSPKATLTIP